MEDRCVCCGDYIPEGRQVCPICERKGYRNYEQAENVRDDETLHPEFKSRSEKEQALHGRT